MEKDKVKIKEFLKNTFCDLLADDNYYQIGFTTTNGVPTVTATEVL